LETSRPLIDELRHRLTVTLPERPVLIEADPIRLSQVFANLLNNAAKYTDPGGQIELVVREKGIEVDIVVRDNGLGIPSDMLQKVFELFAQVERSLEKTRGGLGIGLTIVKQLVEMHGGRVEAQSDGPGKGSEFVVTLPVVTTTADASPSENDRSEYNQPSSRRRIVVADDNEDSATSLAMMLTIMGHEVRAVHDGREAIEVAAASRPDVVILDIGMAKLNGYDTCRQIKAQPWAKKTVLIAVTGWGQEEDRRRSREAGFDYHLVKPVDPSMIATLLSGL
jgi:CheY-like chemotaxis protein/anti-sigma regulatory factor (Ser/Thr protein kinase)